MQPDLTLNATAETNSARYSIAKTTDDNYVIANHHDSVAVTIEKANSEGQVYSVDSFSFSQQNPGSVIGTVNGGYLWVSSGNGGVWVYDGFLLTEVSQSSSTAG
jgi:hypothetical protein